MMKSKPDNKKAEQEYVYGDDSAMTLKYHASRTTETHAFWFLPYLKPGMSLLDCGCGSGSISMGLAEILAPGQVSAVDISESEIDRAGRRASERKIPNIRFEMGDIYQLGFPNDSFDALFSHNCLEHIPEPSRALQEMCRVLKPGGVIGIRDGDFGGYLTAPDENGLFSKGVAVWEEEYKITGGGNPRIGRHLGRLLFEAGFVDVKMSASYEVYSDPERRRFLMGAIVPRFSDASFVERVTQYGLATTEELESIKKAFLAWQETPGAIHAISHCEAVGRKP